MFHSKTGPKSDYSWRRFTWEETIVSSASIIIFGKQPEFRCYNFVGIIIINFWRSCLVKNLKLKLVFITNLTESYNREVSLLNNILVILKANLPNTSIILKIQEGLNSKCYIKRKNHSNLFRSLNGRKYKYLGSEEQIGRLSSSVSC